MGGSETVLGAARRQDWGFLKVQYLYLPYAPAQARHRAGFGDMSHQKRAPVFCQLHEPGGALTWVTRRGGGEIGAVHCLYRVHDYIIGRIGMQRLHNIVIAVWE